jgi:hypothetical protein
MAFTTARSDFDIGGGRVNVKNGRLEGEVTSVTFEGYATLDQRVDLAVNLAIGGNTGERLALLLPTRVIPLRVSGPMDKPRITPNLSAADLAKQLLRIPGLGGGIDPLDPTKSLEGIRDILRGR